MNAAEKRREARSDRLMFEFYESRGWPRDHKLAWCHCVERGRREIVNDVLLGIVPADVSTFASLHDHVDANEYGWGFEAPMPLEEEAFHRFTSGIQNALDQWIRAGGIGREMRGE